MHDCAARSRRPEDARSPHRPAHRRRRRPRHPDAGPAPGLRLRRCACSTCARSRASRTRSSPTSPTRTRCARRSGASTRSSTSRASPWKPPSRRSSRRTSRAPTTCTRPPARRASAAIVFASSNHAVGYTPRPRGDDPLIPVDTPRRPDTFYGLSKCFGEDLAQLYWDKHGMETVSVRIGSCFPEPTSVRMLSVWMSPADGARLFHAALTAENVGHTVVYGSSANTRLWWDLDHRAGARLRAPGRLRAVRREAHRRAGRARTRQPGARLPGRPLRDRPADLAVLTGTRRSTGRAGTERARPPPHSGTTRCPISPRPINADAGPRRARRTCRTGTTGQHRARNRPGHCRIPAVELPPRARPGPNGQRKRRGRCRHEHEDGGRTPARDRAGRTTRRLGRRHRARRRAGRGQGDRTAGSARPGGPRPAPPHPRRRLSRGERRLRDDARLPRHQPRPREAPDRGRRGRAARGRRDRLRRRGLHPAAHRRGTAPGPAADRGHRVPAGRGRPRRGRAASPSCCSAAGSGPAPSPPSTTGRRRCWPASSSTWRSSAPTASPANTASPPPTRPSARSRPRRSGPPGARSSPACTPSSERSASAGSPRSARWRRS